MSASSRWPFIEQRTSERFPVELDVRYKVAYRGISETGAAKTINMSSRGVLLSADFFPLPGLRVELAIKWPARLSGVCGLQLVTRGHVVWHKANRVAIQFEKREFRTAGLANSIRTLNHAIGGPAVGVSERRGVEH